MSKRAAEDPLPAGSSGPPFKKVQFEPIKLGSVSSLEDMDMKVIQFQNKKLSQRLEQRLRTESELRQRIEQLEKRQMQDDAVLNVINRYWNQLNEDLRILLQRFDAETADENESKNESEATTSFLALLSTWDKAELDEKLANRVQVSQRAVAKLIRAFDRLSQRNEKITQALSGEANEGGEVPNLDETVRQVNAELQAENRNLHSLNTSLHEKNHSISLKLKELQEQLTGKETEAAELQNRVDDLEYELQKLRHRADSLEHHLAESLEKIKYIQQNGPVEEKTPVGAKATAAAANTSTAAATKKVSSQQLEDLQKELEEQRELAVNRLTELDRLHQNHRDVLQQLEHLKMDIRQLPESVVVETTEYKCLQSQFSVLYNESMALKTQLDEARQQWYSAKNAHLRQIEQMEGEELLRQKQLRTEVIQLEDMLAQVRKEYEMLRIEFEQQLAANEQTGPINREMRHLITSLQNHNKQLKGEVHRYRRKYRESSSELAKTKKDLEDALQKIQTLQDAKDARDAAAEAQRDATDAAELSDVPADSHDSNPAVKEELLASTSEIKKEPDEETPTEEKKEADEEGDKKDVKKEKVDVKKEIKQEGTAEVKADAAAAAAANAKTKEQKNAEAEMIRDLKAQLKKALNDQREMKLLLDMYRGASKEMRDKAQLMAAERKARVDVDELKQQLKKMQESKREERKRLADDEAMRKIRQLEETVHQLQKQVAAQKQEEEALLNEMEVTGQAFEDMQEQNSRLIQQLREKDDANFKLMSERIKAQQIHKLQREEKDVLVEQVVSTLNMQVEAQNQVIRRLEEKERLLQTSLAAAEKELMFRQQTMEMNKRKAIESAQSAADLKLHLEKYHSQMKEAQQVVAEKTSTLEAEAYKTRRLNEELAQLKRRVERFKKIEAAGTADEVLREELREYKDTLTCPSCKVTRKDAVLTKCFHVFCFDCLRTRYETRQRKCPKCNAAFGANDYHRLYLS